MTGNMIFAKRIKQFREKRGDSQEDLANLFGYKKQAVSHWENNGKVPRGKVLETLAERYKTSSDYLLGFTDDAEIHNPTDCITNEEFQKLVIQQLTELTKGQSEIRQSVARIENEHGEKIGALYDGFQVRGDQIEKLQEHLDERLDSIQNDIGFDKQR